VKFADTSYLLALLNPDDDRHFEQAGFKPLLK
jgi:hypothetical protein